MPNKNITKYLNMYAEPDTRAVNSHEFDRTYKNVVVIPAYDEDIDFIERLSNHKDAKDTLLVLVVNQPDTILENIKNNKIIKLLKETSYEISANTFISNYKNITILTINKTVEKNRIPKDMGVGLARKIGCDIAVNLIENHTIKNTWIYSTDADAHLPENYFTQPPSKENNLSSAIVFDFSHISNEDLIGKATTIYEQCIKYYTRELSNAGSTYGFPTLGSCLAVDIQKYCNVRGFPKKPAGEDFYLLNKLAKIGSIIYRTDICINIDARNSTRVPFGTGPAAQKIVDLLNQDKEPYYYNPKIFRELAIWLKVFTQEINQLPEKIFRNEKDFEANLKKIISHNTLATQQALIDIRFEKFITHCQKQSKSAEQTIQNFHQWFDAFKTLKYLHALEKNSYPAVATSQIFKVKQA